MDGPLAWDNHIDQLISRLNSACYATTAVKAMLSREALRMIYISYVHSTISCGIIFGATPLMVLKHSQCNKSFKNYN
jgi:hypothetical protein